MIEAEGVHNMPLTNRRSFLRRAVTALAAGAAVNATAIVATRPAPAATSRRRIRLSSRWGSKSSRCLPHIAAPLPIVLRPALLPKQAVRPSRKSLYARARRPFSYNRNLFPEAEIAP
jgi:hypothetical protein